MSGYCTCWIIRRELPHLNAKCGPCNGYVAPAGLPTRAELLAEMKPERFRVRFPRFRLRRAPAVA